VTGTVERGVGVPTAPSTPSGGPRTAAGHLVRSLVVEVREETDAEAAAYRAVTAPGRVALETGAILLTVAVSLTCANFLADARQPGWLTTPLRGVGLDGLARRITDALTGERREFFRLLWWSSVQIGSYVVLPTIVIRAVLRSRWRDHGLAVRGLASHWKPYALILVVALPFVAAASFTSGFQAKYPFYDLAPGETVWPYLYGWWLLYALQFLALELFFRGFVTLGLASRLGYASLLVMLVPYNMIHYGKPMAEALAAIVGGFVLGTLALRSRSVLWGAGVHVGIALTMDVLALWHADRIF
jgi:membrane protease YdiL (CAAX protease family)